MNKQAQLKTVFSLLIVIGIIILASMFISKFTKSANNTVEDKILLKFEAEAAKEQSISDKIDGFPDVKLSGVINKETIDYGELFTEFFFKHPHNNLIQGFLISFDAPPKIESKYWDFVLFTYTDGVFLGYTDGVKKERLASPSDTLYYLSGVNLCVLPFGDDDDDAAKVLSYAIGIKHEKLSKIPTSEEIDNIIIEHQVSQISFPIARNSKENMEFIPPAKPSITAGYSTDDGKLLGYYKEGTLCFFLTESSSLFSSKNHVNFDKDGVKLIGDGFLYEGFNQRLLKKITDKDKIKR